MQRKVRLAPQSASLTYHSLAQRELDRIRADVQDHPQLYELKFQRMAASPFAFLRGSVDLFYSLLAEQPERCPALPGESVLVGDLHFENFGAYHTDQKKAAAAFDLNDFDEAFFGPRVLDLLRLQTSLILGSRELGTNGTETWAIVERVMKNYARGLRGTSEPARLPGSVRAMLKKVRARTMSTFLRERTRGVSARKLKRDDRYLDLSKPQLAALPAALSEYRGSVATKVRLRELELRDAVFRVAGTGSLGVLRIACLTRGSGKAWLLDFKAQQSPACCHLVGPLPATEPRGQQVARYAARLVRHAPAGLGWTTLAGTSMSVRRLTPSDDKLDWTRVPKSELGELAAHLGRLVGNAHRRGTAPETKAAAWTPAQLRELYAAAVALAVIHEGVYLAFCELAARAK